MYVLLFYVHFYLYQRCLVRLDHNLDDGGSDIDSGKEWRDFDTLTAWLNGVDDNDEYQLAWKYHQDEHTRCSCTDTCQSHSTEQRTTHAYLFQ